MSIPPRWRAGAVPLTGLYVAVCAAFALSGQLFMELHGGAGERDTSMDPRHLAFIVVVASIALAMTSLGAGFGRMLAADATSSGC